MRKTILCLLLTSTLLFCSCGNYALSGKNVTSETTSSELDPRMQEYEKWKTSISDLKELAIEHHSTIKDATDQEREYEYALFLTRNSSNECEFIKLSSEELFQILNTNFIEQKTHFGDKSKVPTQINFMEDDTYIVLYSHNTLDSCIANYEDDTKDVYIDADEVLNAIFKKIGLKQSTIDKVFDGIKDNSQKESDYDDIIVN